MSLHHCLRRCLHPLVCVYVSPYPHPFRSPSPAQQGTLPRLIFATPSPSVSVQLIGETTVGHADDSSVICWHSLVSPWSTIVHPWCAPSLPFLQLTNALRSQDAHMNTRITKIINEAKRMGYPRYTTGNSCINGHTTDRYISNRTCTACVDANKRRYLARQQSITPGFVGISINPEEK